jgi:methionyl-tRNA formyltransferase
MKRYVLATQQPWGVKAFEILKSRGGDWWMTHTVAGLRASINSNVRYVFSVNFSSYVPPSLLAMAETVNFHSFGPSVQPMVWHRGGGPIEGLILRGFTETMIGAHRMLEEVDAGPIYGTRGPVSLAGTKAQILDRFIAPCISLIRWIVETEPEPTPQVGEVVKFQRLTPEAYRQFWEARR